MFTSNLKFKLITSLYHKIVSTNYHSKLYYRRSFIYLQQNFNNNKVYNVGFHVDLLICAIINLIIKYMM